MKTHGNTVFIHAKHDKCMKKWHLVIATKLLTITDGMIKKQTNKSINGWISIKLLFYS